MNTTIHIRKVPARPALLVHGRFPDTEISTEVGRMFGDVARWAGQHAVTTSGPAFTRYTTWAGGQCEIDAGFVVAAPPRSADAPISVGHIGGCLAACATHVGPYDALSQTYASMQEWITDNGYETAGEMWEEYLTSPDTPPSQKRTDVFWPVRKAK